MRILLILLTLIAPLQGHTVTITSDRAVSYPDKKKPGTYRFVHTDNVTAQGDQLGILNCDRLVFLLTPTQAKKELCQQIIASNVTLTHKAYILTARTLLLKPGLRTGVATGDVCLTYTEHGKPSITTHATHASCDLSQHTMHAWSTDTTPVTTTITHDTTAKNSSSRPNPSTTDSSR